MRIYQKLCSKYPLTLFDNKPNLEMHKHHIVPRHQNGNNDLSNLCWLTPKEHKLAHFLLWQINKHPNDLRSANMLGAELSTHQRRIVGKWCYANKIGIFAPHNKHIRDVARAKGLITQMKNQIGIHNVSHPYYRKWRAAAGSIGAKKQMENQLGIHVDDQKLRSQWASLGGKAACQKKKENGYYQSSSHRKFTDAGTEKIRGSKWMNNGLNVEMIFRDNIQTKLNEGWIFGRKIKSSSEVSL